MRDVSRGNDFYWWKLSNPRIELAKEEFWHRADLFWKGTITEIQFLIATDLYFQVVRAESDAEWQRTYGRIGKELANDTPLPVAPSCKLTVAELDFIIGRFVEWESREGGEVWWCEFYYRTIDGKTTEPDAFITNKLGEVDYSSVELPGIDKSYMFTWGKYRRLTLGEVMLKDPGYLKWANEKTEKLPLSDALKQEILDLIGQFELSRAERVNHEIKRDY